MSRTTHLDIRGMSCANCSGTVEDALSELAGIESANVNFATDEGSVEYDSGAVSLAEIYETIEEAGYEPVADEVSIGISDMTCSNCAETNEDALEALPGVISAKVNYATDEGVVRYNPNDVDRDALYEAIEGAGYSPVREEGGEGDDGDGRQSSTDRRDAARQEEIRHQRNLTIFGAVLSAPLIFFMLEHYLFDGLLGDAILGVPLGWVMFGLATPVQYLLGKEFYENSYKAVVKNRTANMDVLIALGSSTAYFYSVAVLLGFTGSLYFDTAALILVFITLGNYLEARSKGQASEALRKLLEMEADTATVVEDGEEKQVPVEDVAVGDVMVVRPGEKIPTDGTVVEGESAVDDPSAMSTSMFAVRFFTTAV